MHDYSTSQYGKRAICCNHGFEIWDEFYYYNFGASSRKLQGKLAEESYIRKKTEILQKQEVEKNIEKHLYEKVGKESQKALKTKYISVFR